MKITLSVIDENVVLHGSLTTKIIRITDIDVIKKANTRQDAILIEVVFNFYLFYIAYLLLV